MSGFILKAGLGKARQKGCSPGDITAQCMALEGTGKPQRDEGSENFAYEEGTGDSLAGKPEETWPMLF